MHRDIKPPNIVICAPNLEDNDSSDQIIDLTDVEYKVADLNLASFSPNGFERSKCGTPLYSSPEMLAGKPYSFANDVWQLGASIFQFAALKTPWSAESEAELKNK